MCFSWLWCGPLPLNPDVFLPVLLSVLHSMKFYNILKKIFLFFGVNAHYSTKRERERVVFLVQESGE